MNGLSVARGPRRVHALQHSRAPRRGPLRALGWLVVGVSVGALPVSPAQGTAAGQEPTRVLAAASLSEVLPRALASHPGVEFSFDATSRLAAQVDRGAPAEVIVTADRRWMEWLEERGRVVPGTATVVATNTLVIAVPRGSELELTSLADLLAVEGRIGVAGENVPAGRYADASLRAEGVMDGVAPRLVRGGSVRTVVEWVALGEVEAALVYGTDAIGDERLRVAFEVPSSAHPPIEYLAAVLVGARDVGRAGEVVAALGSAAARDALLGSGWGVQGQGSPTAAIAAADQGTPRGVGASMPSAASAIRLSLLVGALAVLLGSGPAIGLGWLLARRDFPGKSLVSTLVLVPLVLPPVVTGFLLLTLLGNASPVGRFLTSLGLPVSFSLLGAALAAAVVGLPLYVVAVRGAFEAIDRRYEEMALTLGSRPLEAFRRVALPLALPGVAAGAVLAFARALGEFGATIVLAGNLEGRTRTIPLAIYSLLESPGGRGYTWALVGASVLLSLLALLGYETLSRRQRRRLEDRS